MKGMGALIVLAIIALQGVAAIVAGIKKQRAKAALSEGTAPSASTAPPSEQGPSPRSIAAKRQAMLDRRRQQIEELRTRSTQAPTAPRQPAPPAPVPPVIPAFVSVPTPEVVEAEEPDTLSAYARPGVKRRRARSHHRTALTSMLRNRETLKQAFIIKELLDQPLALRPDGQQPG